VNSVRNTLDPELLKSSKYEYIGPAAVSHALKPPIVAEIGTRFKLGYYEALSLNMAEMILYHGVSPSNYLASQTTVWENFLSHLQTSRDPQTAWDISGYLIPSDDEYSFRNAISTGVADNASTLMISRGT
jgi:hypothetical protein